MKVGFIGVGAIGLPMARRLFGHHEVTVFDLDRERVAQLVSEGASAAPTASDAAVGDVTIVMVATPAQLDAALFGDGGAAHGLRSGSTLIIMSSVGIDAVVAAERVLAPRGVTVVDAPVTGGVVRAVSGELTILLGGTPSGIEPVRALLALMGTTLADCGPAVGDGQAVKLVNQLLCSVHLAAAAEALNFARALGLDAEKVLSIVAGGAAGSFMLGDRGPRMLEAHPPVLSAIDIFVKDSTLVQQAAIAAEAPTPLLSAAAERFTLAQRAGFGRRDDSSVIETFRTR